MEKHIPMGTKVVPHKKSIGMPLHECMEWRIGQTQGFLYVTNYIGMGNYILSAFNNHDGSMYHATDFEIYDEEKHTDWKILSKPIKLNGEVEVELDFSNREYFDEAVRHDFSLVCMSDLHNDFVLPLKLRDIRKLHKYLERVIEYAETVE